MVQPRLRSRTFRRVKVRTAGGRLVTHYLRRKPAVAQCGNCGNKLQAVPRGLPYVLRNLSKTEKRPQRPYGGIFCSACSRNLFKRKARA
ncbi:50S ribosomal protein L34e [Candidatus Woesearchaeota archaeon]|nr:50S ribosomal protein L34e [Candidatus Woesearchaeota archaeon]